MNKDQYDRLLKVAGKVDDVVKFIDVAADKAVTIAAFLEEYAENLRNEAERAANNSPWAGTTDNISDAQTRIVDITGKSPEEVAKMVREWLEQHRAGTNKTNLDPKTAQQFNDIVNQFFDNRGKDEPPVDQ